MKKTDSKHELLKKLNVGYSKEFLTRFRETCNRAGIPVNPLRWSFDDGVEFGYASVAGRTGQDDEAFEEQVTVYLQAADSMSGK